jgi:anti-sigma-K factor RskA
MDMHPNDTAINEYVEGTLDSRDRADVERHLATCVPCRQTVDDLREILGATGTLGPLEPPLRVWSRLERAITLEPPVARGVPPNRPGEGVAGHLAASRSVVPPRGSRYAWLAVAAAIVLATAVGLRFGPSFRDARRVPPAAAGPASAGAAAASVASELRLAETHYEKAIKGLEQIATSEQDSLDPRTAATVRKSLAVIDQAISESRAAVQSEPASQPAQESLIENFKAKIGLLQNTVALINEMRKGNEAGAARIVSGLKQQKGD